MKNVFLLLIASLVAGLAGCATRPAGPGERPSSSTAAGEADVPPAGSYVIQVESQPSGATVVVDGIPQGRTPFRVMVPGTTRGFFRSDVVIAVRFVATDAAHLSATSSESFSPTDRIPLRLIFTPSDVQRVR